MKQENSFSKPHILERAGIIIAGRRICNHCLGRQFAQISTGLTNQERGWTIRGLLNAEEPADCSVCGNLFQRLDQLAEAAVARLKGIEWSTFLVGTKLSRALLAKEEGLWEEVGIDYCEPIKSEINREVGKRITGRTGKEYDPQNPDVVILLDMGTNTIHVQISPLFVYGEYQKLARGIPQTKWEHYPVTVEDIIAKPFMTATKGAAHALHAAGREDIDARCLAWRPFVLEIERPATRRVELKTLEGRINRSRKAQVRGLRLSTKKEVIAVKSMRPDKTYRVLVRFEKEPAIGKAKQIVGIIKQQTPTRVLHRRANKMRKKQVKAIVAKKIRERMYEFRIRGEAGLYVKELVTGDGGRTRPSIAELVGSPAVVKELDVVKIHL